MFFDSFVYNKNLRKVCNCLELYLVLFFSEQTNYLNLFLVFSNSFVVNESSVLGFCFLATFSTIYRETIAPPAKNKQESFEFV